jgi:hypothetical protein
MTKVAALGFIVGAGVSCVLVTMACALVGHSPLMAAVLTNPLEYLSGTLVAGGSSGAALAALAHLIRNDQV